MIKINRLDHLVLTVASIRNTCDFYTKALGMQVVTFGEGRTALAFGVQKINLHESGREIKPNAKHAGAGNADLCFIADTPLPEVIKHLHACGIATESDIVERTGATGPIRSVYLRDPDGNLLEISNYPCGSSGD